MSLKMRSGFSIFFRGFGNLLPARIPFPVPSSRRQKIPRGDAYVELEYTTMKGEY
jgi:hypothetical protein